MLPTQLLNLILTQLGLLILQSEVAPTYGSMINLMTTGNGGMVLQICTAMFQALLAGLPQMMVQTTACFNTANIKHLVSTMELVVLLLISTQTANHALNRNLIIHSLNEKNLNIR